MQIHGPTHVHGPQPINAPHRNQATQPAVLPDHVSGVDQLDISREADLISRLRDMPATRADRVAQIRAAIEAGQYETDDKLSLALDRLLDELGG